MLPVSVMDLAATFLEYAGVARPKDMDSRSLSGDLLAGKTRSHREHVLSGLGEWRMVWDGRYKLIRGFQDEMQLFDLEADPREPQPGQSAAGHGGETGEAAAAGLVVLRGIRYSKPVQDFAIWQGIQQLPVWRQDQCTAWAMDRFAKDARIGRVAGVAKGTIWSFTHYSGQGVAHLHKEELGKCFSGPGSAGRQIWKWMSKYRVQGRRASRTPLKADLGGLVGEISLKVKLLNRCVRRRHAYSNQARETARWRDGRLDRE